MTTHALGMLALALALALPLDASVSAKSKQAAEAWAQRGEPGKTEEAVKLWEEAAKANPQNVDAHLGLTKALGRLVRRTQDIKERRRLADQARAHAETAVRLAPQNSHAHTALGEALGQWAEARKSVRSLKAVKAAVSALEKAVSIDPKNAYAHMLLAEFYRQSPKTISVGDKDKALVHAKRAVEHGPAYAIHHLALAQALIDHGRKEEAIAVLRTILALKPPEDAIPETLADQKKAKALLHSLEQGAASASTTCEETQNTCSENP